MLNAINGLGSYPYTQISQMVDQTESLFAQIDANKDNSLDQNELKTLADTMAQKTGLSMSVYDILSQLDTNGNGQVSQTEFEAGRPEGLRHHGKGSAQDLMGMPDDKGNDNSSGSLDPLDTNGDGIVDDQELAAAGLNKLTQNYMSLIESMSGNQEDNQGLVDLSA